MFTLLVIKSDHCVFTFWCVAALVAIGLTWVLVQLGRLYITFFEWPVITVTCEVWKGGKLSSSSCMYCRSRCCLMKQMKYATLHKRPKKKMHLIKFGFYTVKNYCDFNKQFTGFYEQ